LCGIVAPAETGLHERATVIAGRAEAAARAITNPYRQADALARLAEALGSAGDTPFACRLAAAACAVGHWATAAKPVLILAPSAWATIQRLLQAPK
jgi:hypothetical protein